MLCNIFQKSSEINEKVKHTVRFHGLSGSAHRRSKRTPVGMYLIRTASVLHIKQDSSFNIKN